jgi:3-deoxy-D-manno-octulosonic-acid transferase
MEDLRGALAKTVKALEPYLNPLTVTARLQPKVAAAGNGR